MTKQCGRCGTSNLEDARFCRRCRNSLHDNYFQHNNGYDEQPLHNNRAAEIIETKRAKAEMYRDERHHAWHGFSLNEKIIGVGAIASLIAFVLPWASLGIMSVNGFTASSNNAAYLYLLPITMIASIVLLFVTRGGSNTRQVLMMRWQIVIGSVAATAGLLLLAFINTIGAFLSMMGGLGSIFGGSISAISAGIGIYLFIAGAAAIVIGAFRRQGELLQYQG